MMGIYEHWPYVNFHELNTNWLIEEIPKVYKSKDEAQASAEASAESAEHSEQQAANAATRAYDAAQSALEAVQSAENAEQAELSAKNYSDHIADPVSGLVTTWLNDHITSPTDPPIDNSLTVSGAAADSRTVGNYILSNDQITWNQLASVFTRSSETLGNTGVTYTRSADQKEATFNGTAGRVDHFLIIQSGLGTSVAGHKYALYTPRTSGDAIGRYFFYLQSRDARDYGNGVIWTATESVNITVGIEWNLASNLPTFNNLTVNVPIITDLTQCFGAGNEPTIEEFRALFPNNSYDLDAGTTKKLSLIQNNALDIYNIKKALTTALEDISETKQSIKQDVKLKILSFNCGHYNYGSSSEYAGDDMQDKIIEWKKMLAKYKPDIMLGQEMSLYFDAAQTVQAIDTIFKPLLPNFYYGNYTKMVSKYPFTNRWQQTITVVVGGTTYTRPLTCALININGVEIALCSVHLPPGYSATDTTVREAMRDELIAAFENYDHVILGGDYNESTDSFFAPFESAGYSLGNHGYFGTIETLPNESVDNIIVKGFTFYDAITDPEDACTSDHYPFASEIHIN